MFSFMIGKIEKLCFGCYFLLRQWEKDAFLVSDTGIWDCTEYAFHCTQRGEGCIQMEVIFLQWHSILHLYENTGVNV